MPGVLLEIIPPSTDAGFGGFHLYARIHQLNDSLRSPALIELLEPPKVTGEVVLAFPAERDCVPVAVKVTLTPREANLGLVARRLSAVSFPAASFEPVNLFSFPGVPLGTYDLYWEDTGYVDGISDECAVVPQVFRGLEIEEAQAFKLVQNATRSLRVIIPWRDDLDGWVVDVVHAATGQRLSTQRAFTAEMQQEDANGQVNAIAELRVSEVAGDDYPSSGEALRLRPPQGLNRPTTLLGLAALEVIERGVAQVPAIETFSELIEFDAWAWQGGDSRHPVVGQVEFIASALLDAPDGVFVSYTQVVDISDDGWVIAQLPPGDYRARVHPAEAGPSLFETAVTVWGPAPGDAGDGRQAGRVLEVPSGVKVSGAVELFGGVEAENTIVRTVPITRGGIPNPLGARSFVPRSASALVDARGRFSIDPVDCRGCDGELAAAFTLAVQPPEAARLPWLVASPISVAGDLDLGRLRVEVPAFHFGLLRYRTPRGGVGPFPDALIKAFILLDQQGEVVSVDTPSCAEMDGMDPMGVCAHRALQIGETRSGDDGTFQLVLPTRLLDLSP